MFAWGWAYRAFSPFHARETRNMVPIREFAELVLETATAGSGNPHNSRSNNNNSGSSCRPGGNGDHEEEEGVVMGGEAVARRVRRKSSGEGAAAAAAAAAGSSTTATSAAAAVDANTALSSMAARESHKAYRGSMVDEVSQSPALLPIFIFVDVRVGSR